MDSFVGLNAQVLGISVDHIPTLKAWAESLGGINYPLLSDFWPHGEVARLYRVMREEDGHSERAIFVVDKNGYIRYIDIHNIDDRPDNEEVRKVLRKLEEGSTSPDAGAAANTAGVYFDDALEEGEAERAEVVLYCARWCKDCRKARAWLEEQGVLFQEVDIDYDMAARNQIRRWANGFLVTPVIDIGGNVVLDYDVPKLEEALRKYRG